jgi:hypothetical protein
MKNLILAITRKTIPYVGELKLLPLVKSCSDAILMQQLDYWFSRYPNGFFKFLEPCDHENYKEGDSWSEELFFSGDEFRTAFGHLAIAYKSKKQFDLAPDKFQEKYYCSYFDRISKKTFYFRNHELVDNLLTDLTTGKLKQSNLGKQTMAISVNGQCQFTETDNGNLQKQTMAISKSIYTEITTETTSEITAESVDAPENLKFPKKDFLPETDDVTPQKQATYTDSAHSFRIDETSGGCSTLVTPLCSIHRNNEAMAITAKGFSVDRGNL